LIALLLVPAFAQAPQTSWFGQTWGTWLHQVQLGPGVRLPAMVTMHLDGSLVGNVGLMFGGLPNATTRYGPISGAWQRTGWKTVAATSLVFRFDAATGILNGYERHRCALDFSDDFESYKGTEVVETVACDSPTACPNPLDPAVKWTPGTSMPPGGFTVSGSRVAVVAISR
jgi:hypothetical protein